MVPNIVARKKKINLVDIAVFLVIILDARLLWSPHISNVIKTAQLYSQHD